MEAALAFLFIAGLAYLGTVAVIVWQMGKIQERVKFEKSKKKKKN